MAIPSVTYTFIDGTTAYGSEVQQNFSDVIAALTDGTKDITVNAVTTTGAVTVNGAVTLGNAAADVITWNGTAPSILLDNGATNGGRIYFNGGSTSYINSSADGTDLSLAGFTNITLTAAGALGVEAGISGTTITGSSYVTGTYFLPTADDTSAPGANFLYKANVPKAWAQLNPGAAGAVTVENDHNVASAGWANNDLTVDWDTNLADTEYATVTNLYNETSGSASFQNITVTGQTVSLAVLSLWDASGAVDWDTPSSIRANVIVMGDQ